jgi:hypothetical protein
MAKRSKAIDRVKDRMRSGAVLMMMNTVFGKKWYVVGKTSAYKGPGREVSEEIAKALIKEPDVYEGKDGLFPGISQTYHIG